MSETTNQPPDASRAALPLAEYDGNDLRDVLLSAASDLRHVAGGGQCHPETMRAHADSLEAAVPPSRAARPEDELRRVVAYVADRLGDAAPWAQSQLRAALDESASPARPADGREAIPETLDLALRECAQALDDTPVREGRRGWYNDMADAVRQIAAGTHPAVALVDRARLATMEADAARLDEAQRLLFGADFGYDTGDDGDTVPVALLRIPPGVRVGADVRAFLDAARSARAAEGDHA